LTAALPIDLGGGVLRTVSAVTSSFCSAGFCSCLLASVFLRACVQACVTVCVCVCTCVCTATRVLTFCASAAIWSSRPIPVYLVNRGAMARPGHGGAWNGASSCRTGMPAPGLEAQPAVPSEPRSARAYRRERSLDHCQCWPVAADTAAQASHSG
jgi:hypothetical protein